MLNGKTITEQHFDFKNTIIKELQTQVDSTKDLHKAKDWAPITKQWIEGVGGAQKLFPMHVVYEYCSDEPVHPEPNYTSQTKTSKKFYNMTTQKYQNWFQVDFSKEVCSTASKKILLNLSKDFAIIKASFGAEMIQIPPGGLRLTSHKNDLAAMTALCEVRTNDFINLQSQLEDQMKLDNHHQVSQI